MSIFGNVFNNSAEVTPSLEGQGEDVGTENVNEATPVPPSEDGQVTDEPVVEPSITEEPTSEPEWAKEYKTPEEMYAALKNLDKSYSSLRPEYTRVTQELSAIRKSATPQHVTTQGDSPEEILLGKIQSMIAPVKEQNAELMMQNEIVSFASKNPDFMELAVDISDTFKEDPNLWNLKNPIEVVYGITKAKKIASEVGKVVAKAKDDAYADKEIKVLNSQGTKVQSAPQEAEKTPDQIIKESILGVMSRGGSIF